MFCICKPLITLTIVIPKDGIYFWKMEVMSKEKSAIIELWNFEHQIYQVLALSFLYEPLNPIQP